MTKYLFLGMGVWCLYHGWRGIVPSAGAKSEVDKPMRGSTRLIFLLGGAMVTGMGIVLWRY